MRRAYEPLFLKYSVDVVFSGHVHGMRARARRV
jgi:predicted MPP superfamily phosphohydrolase